MIFEHCSRSKKQLLIIFTVILLFGIFALSWQNFFNKKEIAEFGEIFLMKAGEKAIFSDSMSLTLLEINDSRCNPNVQCIWQGELSALINFEKENILKEIRLGTISNSKVIFDKYLFSLEEATENTITLLVDKKY